MLLDNSSLWLTIYLTLSNGVTFLMPVFLEMYIAHAKQYIASMDHSPLRQTFELAIFISTAGKSILNLVNYSEVWLQNIVKCGKCSPVKIANFVCFCIMCGKV